mgnify:CR=1 FL=1
MSQSLEALIQKAGAVKLLRNSQAGAHVYPGVLPEYTNWRDEQRAWQNTAVLFNQSYHMTDLYVSGPDALTVLSDLGVNSFKSFKVDQAKQIVVCNPRGYVRYGENARFDPARTITLPRPRPSLPAPPST